MMINSLKNMKSKLVVGVVFVLFVPTGSARDGGSYSIAFLREIHAERSFMRICVMFGVYVIKVMEKLPYSLLLIHWRYLILSLDIKMNFPDIFNLIFSYVEPSPVHIVGTVKVSLSLLSNFVF